MAFTTFQLLWLLIFCMSRTAAVIRFTNVRCETFNSNLTQLEYCRLRAVSRNIKDISIKWNLYDIPVNSVAVKLQFLKKSNGYRPFMRELKFDGCQYLAKPKNFIINSLFKMWSKYTNMNHTCPYNHDLIVDKLQMDESILNWIPFPKGDYSFLTTWYVKGLRRLQMDFYFSFLED